jgi:hypothetical protein
MSERAVAGFPVTGELFAWAHNIKAEETVRVLAYQLKHHAPRVRTTAISWSRACLMRAGLRLSHGGREGGGRLDLGRLGRAGRLALGFDDPFDHVASRTWVRETSS